MVTQSFLRSSSCAHRPQGAQASHVMGLPLSPRKCLSHPSPRRCQSPVGRLSIVCNVAATTTDLYELLGVPTSATEEDIKLAFRRKARKLHPDVNKAPGAQDLFMELKQAYEESARAKDPRFARFERWRSEVVPDLEMQLQVWTDEIDKIVEEASVTLTSMKVDIDRRLDALSALVPMAGDCTVAELRNGYLQEAKGLMDEVYGRLKVMDGEIETMQNRVKAQYNKRYEQVLGRYPAYPDLVWIDVWEERSGQWLGTAEGNRAEWQKDKEGVEAQVLGMVIKWQEIATYTPVLAA